MCESGSKKLHLAHLVRYPHPVKSSVRWYIVDRQTLLVFWMNVEAIARDLTNKERDEGVYEVHPSLVYLTKINSAFAYNATRLFGRRTHN